MDLPGLLAGVRPLLEVLRLPATLSGSPQTICFQASVEGLYMWKSGRHWFILVTVTVTSELLVSKTHHLCCHHQCSPFPCHQRLSATWGKSSPSRPVALSSLDPIGLFTGWSRVWQGSSSPEALPLRPGTWRFLISLRDVELRYWKLSLFCLSVRPVAEASPGWGGGWFAG